MSGVANIDTRPVILRKCYKGAMGVGGYCFAPEQAAEVTALDRYLGERHEPCKWTGQRCDILV